MLRRDCLRLPASGNTVRVRDVCSTLDVLGPISCLDRVVAWWTRFFLILQVSRAFQYLDGSKPRISLVHSLFLVHSRFFDACRKLITARWRRYTVKLLQSRYKYATIEAITHDLHLSCDCDTFPWRPWKEPCARNPSVEPAITRDQLRLRR